MGRITLLASTAIGIVVLAGWILRVKMLTTFSLGPDPTKANAAIGIVALAGAVQRARHRGNRHVVLTTALLSLVPATIGLLTMAQDAFGWDLGIDQLLFDDPSGIGHPGRPSAVTALILVLLAIGATTGALGRRSLRVPPHQILAVVSLTLTWLAMMGFTFGAGTTFGSGATNPIAVPTVLALASLSVAVLFLPTRDGFMAMMTSPSAGGGVARKLVPAAVLIPTILSMLAMVGRRSGAYGRDLEVALLVLTTIGILASMSWRFGLTADAAERERTRSEAELRESEARFRASLESLLDGFTILEPARNEDDRIVDFRYLYINAAGAMQDGYAAEDIVGKTMRELHPGLSTLERIDLYGNVVSTGEAKSVEGVVFQDLPGRRGSRRVYDMKVVPFGDGVAVARSDITARLAAEEEVAMFFEVAPALFCVAGFDGKLKRVNGAWEASLGYSPEELLSRPYLELVHPDDVAATTEIAARAMAGETITSFENRYRTKSGSYRWFRWTSASAPDREQVFATAIDVTENHRVAELLARQTEAVASTNRELQEASMAKDRFLANMSHELRTPLNSIIGFTGTLLMELPGPLNDEQRAQLTMVQAGGRHLLSIIDDLLDLRRLESGKVDLELEPVDVASVAQEVRASLQPLAEEKGLTIDLDVPSGMSWLADRRAVSQILLNLANNAIKFTDAGTIVIRGITGEGTEARVDVVDTGVGIAPEDQAKLFEPFERGGAGRAGGTGLGLHISRKLASMLGGTLVFESEVGVGSTFSLILPRVA